ncbi:MAG: lipoprotein-releasing ABC transporter ATP-binding protein LolD [Rhodanobacteraceae bacterium]|nr:lipoprotein-releasing ABC transporter ATP-binding protein LolD [Rhodanobacteraceae bacterium]MBK7042479.1 lipoprotein-releasing ABC transporter ATP-binding protein LolD [Rhodanobacteraceae bacterium]MBP9155365.1 lipoprotein-releasing ABC transporter ATP-binding protein LolD [Xanthomonadales bacterium]HQW80574.1 lipoprotein-releasing ABC transporter ATP-binding protein LolD [Pseudomonadota bacterium]
MNTNNDIVLAAHGVAKTYHETGVETPVFSGIDFAVRAGEAIAIMGASGAGKSTLLHLLGGLDVPDCGEITVAGQRMNALSDSARGRLRNEALGFVYQFHHLLPEFTALENVAMPLLIRGLSVAAARAAAQQILDRVGLGARLEHKPGELSGGERQRAAIARALVTTPKCVLADEPTGNLDAGNSDAICSMLLALKRDLGTAIVIVTHSQELASRMDRVLELCGGKLVPR